MKNSVKGAFFVVLVLMAAVPSYGFTLRPQWVPQAQFAGYYMAVEKGFYQDAGIDLQIKDGKPGIVGLQEISSGRTDFATSWLISAIRHRAKGNKVVLIGQFFQRPALMLLAKKSSGIDDVNKFGNHMLGVWQGDFQIPPKALLRKFNLRDVRIVNQAFSMDAFLKGEIDIASAMRYNEYKQVIDAGIDPGDLITFNYNDLGMNLPEDGIYVHEDFWKKNPEACTRFVKASMEGWKYAFAHKEETVKLMTRLANGTDFKSTEEKQRFMLDEVEKLIDLDTTRLRQEDYDTAISVLKATRMIRKEIPRQSFVAE